MTIVRFTKIKTPQLGIVNLVDALRKPLQEKKNVLWLIAGGSNIPIAQKIMEQLRSEVSREELARLSISLTDERYGPAGHPDSNWKQLLDTGFDLEGISFFHILKGLPLEETVRDYGEHLEDAFKKADFIIAQFGIGADGHIAGMLPHKGATNKTSAAYGYEDKPFTRISMTMPMIRRVDRAFMFAFGESKREALEKLKRDLSLEEEPAQVLKLLNSSIAEVEVFSDQVE
jgi:6-phosphogluconolactonase